ncbi:hypothetical protein G7Z17_g8609 [Cylindrodendrum hubeiense]|uniref:Uncharacterized protein n=1 Tax=Cylindrodendrum hubeiense TaxID=595255 RepID=A0A9P5HAV4_9HYPO|nr:hypothetical protein G7Z17_g8609 [Cylindrodendrum hubeiense]
MPRRRLASTAVGCELTSHGPGVGNVQSAVPASEPEVLACALSPPGRQCLALGIVVDSEAGEGPPIDDSFGLSARASGPAFGRPMLHHCDSLHRDSPHSTVTTTTSTASTTTSTTASSARTANSGACVSIMRPPLDSPPSSPTHPRHPPYPPSGHRQPQSFCAGVCHQVPGTLLMRSHFTCMPALEYLAHAHTHANAWEGGVSIFVSVASQVGFPDAPTRPTIPSGQLLVAAGTFPRSIRAPFRRRSSILLPADRSPIHSALGPRRTLAPSPPAFQWRPGMALSFSQSAGTPSPELILLGS